MTSLSSGGRKFVIALLASGWPNNKTYKWQDCNKIYQYATTYYEMRKVMDPAEGLQSVRLQRAQNPDYDLKTQKLCHATTDGYAKGSPSGRLGDHGDPLTLSAQYRSDGQGTSSDRKRRTSGG